MKTSRVLALLVLFALLPVLAHATDVQIACTAPTKFTDGTTITGAITYKFYGALQGQTKTLLNSTARTSCANTWASAPVGNVCADVTATVNGVESAHSTESCITIAPPTPNAPGAPTLTLAATTPIAYKVRQAVDGVSLVAIGTIPVGTACNASQSVNGYYLIARSTVSLYSRFDTLPLVTYAQCG